LITEDRYSDLLRNPTVHDIGGDQHLVQWEADAKVATTVFTMIDNYDVPGLPNCKDLERLSPAAAQRLGSACP
jgi:hypothetical protein